MKRLIFLLAILALVSSGYAQTVENIRVSQEGEQLKITYRIGASTESQLFNVFLSCSMAGGPKFEPNAVIGDVGENVIGGKSYYMVMWDVFDDVDEVIDPDITVRVELVNDLAAPVTRNAQEQEPAEPEPQQVEPQVQLDEKAAVTDEVKKVDPFRRNGFVAYSGMTGFGFPIGISFGSLNKWGYYVTPLRLAWNSYFDYYFSNADEIDMTFVASAGVTRHFVSAGPYRLHGYAGLGGHLLAETLLYNQYSTAYVMIETGIINVIGGFDLSMGIMISPGLSGYYSTANYYSTVNFVFGIGFVF